MLSRTCKCGFVFAAREFPTVCPRCRTKRLGVLDRLDSEIDDGGAAEAKIDEAVMPSL